MLSLPEHLKHRIGDVGVSAAPADVAAHLLADLGSGARMALVDQALSGADLTWRAVASLQRVMLDKRGLERMEVAGLAQALNRHDFTTIESHRELQAGIHAC